MARKMWAFWLVLSWLTFCHTDCYHENCHKLCISCFHKGSKCNFQVPDNKQRTKLACPSCTREYCNWPSVGFVWTLLHLARTAMRWGHYSHYNPWAWLVTRYYYMACSCSWNNLHCDWLIVGHYSSVMPAGRLQVCKNKAKRHTCVTNNFNINLERLVFTGPK